MTKYVFIPLLFSIILLFGCSKDKNDSDEVNIRIANVSSYDFEEIIVQTTPFDNLNSGEKSDYKVFNEAYRYAYVELKINDQTFKIQPIDFVGETILSNGNYTYEIQANDNEELYGRLSMSLVED